MIVLDTSAIVAILEREPEAAQFTAAVSSATSTHASVVSIQECAMVLFSRHGQAGLDALWRFIADADVEIAAYDEAQLRAAIQAFIQYGKGIHAKARLNMGDCASYALAKTLGVPLLFKGNDFTATDITPAT